MRGAGLPGLALLLPGALSCSSDPAAPEAVPQEVVLRLEIASGDRQGAPVGSALEDFLVVRVSDQADEPISGVPVLWAIVGGGGQLTVKRRATDFEGLAAASLFLGDEPGERRVRAELEEGPSVTFTAHARAHEPLPR